jgi:Inorganic Pyrophosphatase
VLPADYGYVKGSVGKDGDHVDIFLGDKGPNGKAFVVDQMDPATGKFDEHKIVAGVDSVAEAAQTYHAAFPDGSGLSRTGAITELPIDQLKTVGERAGQEAVRQACADAGRVRGNCARNCAEFRGARAITRKANRINARNSAGIARKCAARAAARPSPDRY